MLKHYLNLPGSRSSRGLFSPSLHNPQSQNITRSHWTTCAIAPLRSPQTVSTTYESPTIWAQAQRGASSSALCSARRRSVRYGADDNEEDEGEDDYGHNEEIATLELYSQSAQGEALIVHAFIDGEEVEVLIFKGFSSSLSFGTSPDPSRSILPARAEIRSIDRVKGPLDPSNIEYIEKGLAWEHFKSNFLAD